MIQKSQVFQNIAFNLSIPKNTRKIRFGISTLLGKKEVNMLYKPVTILYISI